MAASPVDTLGPPRFVRLRVPAGARARSRSIEPRQKLVVVGNGMVSQRFCERLVAGGGKARYDVTLFAEEALPAYDRVHLTDIWRGRDPRELILRNVDWYQNNGIELRLEERVQHLDREARTVTTQSGTVFQYDKLVFATGSRATMPKISVDDGATVSLYRTIEDAERILSSVRSLSGAANTVAVVGGGLLGLEAAREIQKLGLRVVVFEGSSQLLPRQLDHEASAALEGTLVAAGIELRLRARIERIERHGDRYHVSLTGGERVEVGSVVVAAGARACDDVARAAGLRCHARGGIEVDRFLRTADPNVFAIGECAAHTHVPHGLVAPGYAMAEVLADNLLGRSRRLDPQRAVTRLKLDLTEVNVLGNPLQSGVGMDLTWHQNGEYRRLVIDRFRVVAAIGVGSWSDLPVLQQYVADRRPLERGQIDDFVATGTLGLGDAAGELAAWADEAVVCQCANVTCGTLRQALRDGAKTPGDLARATSASTLCGGCQPLVAALCGMSPATTPQPSRSGRGLAVAGIAAAALATVTLAAPRMPISRSIQSQGLDVAWFDSFWKQITGFTILGFIVLGLSLSLRKRVKRLRIGSYSGWRLLHGVLGTGGLVALFVHTGFRLGANLNLALMIALLTSAITGAVAGILTTVSTSRGTPSQHWARWTRSIHDYAFWPLSLLVVFHVLKVYYF